VVRRRSGNRSVKHEYSQAMILGKLPDEDINTVHFKIYFSPFLEASDR